MHSLRQGKRDLNVTQQLIDLWSMFDGMGKVCVRRDQNSFCFFYMLRFQDVRKMDRLYGLMTRDGAKDMVYYRNSCIVGLGILALGMLLIVCYMSVRLWGVNRRVQRAERYIAEASIE